MFKQWKNAAAAVAVMIGFSGALFGQKVNLALQKVRADELKRPTQEQHFKNSRPKNSQWRELNNILPLLNPRKQEVSKQSMYLDS